MRTDLTYFVILVDWARVLMKDKEINLSYLSFVTHYHDFRLCGPSSLSSPTESAHFRSHPRFFFFGGGRGKSCTVGRRPVRLLPLVCFYQSAA
jgi:hypothetical protein